MVKKKVRRNLLSEVLEISILILLSVLNLRHHSFYRVLKCPGKILSPLRKYVIKIGSLIY